ncbi:MAG TPA: hypothetical protein VKR59_08420 [Terriglobales bacterium]|nr:hypothetical protein [Terriglobales bacterium]
MRLGWIITLGLCATLPVAGRASWRQDATGSATPQASPAEKPPSDAGVPDDRVKDAPVKDKVPAASSAATPSSSTSPSTIKKRRKRATPPPDGAPLKIVVREGGASEPAAQIAPGLTPAEQARQRRSAEQLLSSTDDQLRQLTLRTLNARQQETVVQIHNYMAGARSALKDGDLRRASTLAEKAHLLSDDLLRH